MRHFRILLLLFGCQFGSWSLLTANGQFLENTWENSLPLRDDNSGFAFWASGIESSAGVGTANDAPRSSNGIYLVESAVGQLTSALSYWGAVGDLIATGRVLYAHSSQYGTIDTLTGKLQRQNGAWDIVFPGVIDIATGQPPANKPQNYFEGDVL